MSNDDQPRMSKRIPIWECTIGISGEPIDLPDGCDVPMRMAVREAFRRITGRPAEFVFSGWNRELDETKQAVVQKMQIDASAYATIVESFDITRDPSPLHIRHDGFGSLCGIPTRSLTRSVEAKAVTEERILPVDTCADCLSCWRGFEAIVEVAASHPDASPTGSDPAGDEPK